MGSQVRKSFEGNKKHNGLSMRLVHTTKHDNNQYANSITVKMKDISSTDELVIVSCKDDSMAVNKHEGLQKTPPFIDGKNYRPQVGLM